MLKLPPTAEEHCEGVFFKFPFKPQHKEGACLKMAAVDMAREKAATQLFMEKNQTNIGSLTLEAVGRLCTEKCLLMSEEGVGHHVYVCVWVHCDPAPGLVLSLSDGGRLHLTSKKTVTSD